MKTMIKKTAAAMTIGFLSVATLSPVMANEFEMDSQTRISKSFSAESLDLEKKTTPGVMQILSTIGKEVKMDEVKGVFNTIKQKTQDELDAYQVKTTKKPSFWRSFFVGFKHGFIETVKAGVKLLIKAAPAIIAMI